MRGVEEISSYNVGKLVAGLKKLSVELFGFNPYIMRDYAQGSLNARSGETAPTWYLRVDPLLRHSTIIRHGDNPLIRYQGFEGRAGICSHLPLTWILKHDPSEWQIGFDDLFKNRLTIHVASNPPEWH